MNSYAPAIEKLIKAFARFPSVGEKTATRMASHVISASREEAAHLARCLLDVKDEIRFCSECFNLAQGDLCEVCKNKEQRDVTTICVVEDPDSLVSIEESAAYKGLYHVLHGAISPLDGIGPDNIRISELLQRVAKGGVSEIIIATNPTVAGEATALLITNLLGNNGVKISRLALGIPLGADIRYSDRMTIGKSLEFRRKV
ncbi:MAG: recombination mediator RecR [Deltaproteobacteria bacterium]|nr:recombination mediator RecR [Deltaproteobacteria bacterium]